MSEDLKQFEVVAARIDAWREFFRLNPEREFQLEKGRIAYFNQTYGFEELLCEFPYKPRNVATLFHNLMRPSHVQPVQFKRTTLFDSRGWCELPLTCFVPVAVADSEVPTIKIGLCNMPWEITSDCFKLYHRIHRNDRIAELYFEHPSCEPRSHGRNRNPNSTNKRGHQVAEEKFSIDAKRPEMHAALLAKVRASCSTHSVRIVDLDVLDRLNGNHIGSYLDPDGRFHCQCGAEHDRGPVNAANSYRCLNCGQTSTITTK